ncbi:MAG TPA: DUF58 domain-containing protein, partial [Anaerolineae bacterium]|nr:DUF58 domain-containing protein [Anaerolineae bacterium]
AVSLDRRHDPRVFWGQTFPVYVEVSNRSWLPVLWLRLHDTVPAGLTTGAVLRQVISLLPRERLQWTYSLAGKRRGYYSFGPLVTLGGDLLGSASYEHQSAHDDYVIVYPKIIALRELGLPSQSPFGVLPSRQRLFEDPTRIRGVRDYQPGDSLRRMDWKTSARVGSLQVRRYEPAIALETAIFLNLNETDYPQPYRRKATELGITIAASVAVHLIEKRQAVALSTNGHDPLSGSATAPSAPLRKGREHLMHLLDLLACIEVASGDEAMPFLDLLSRKSLGLPWGSTVVIVTAMEFEGLMDALLALRRRGLMIILALTCPDRDFENTAQRAGKIGVQALRLWTEQDLDVWR